MMNAPEMRMGLRPTLSTQIIAGTVVRNMTTPTTPVARRESVLPALPSVVVPSFGEGRLLLTREAKPLEDAVVHVSSVSEDRIRHS